MLCERKSGTLGSNPTTCNLLAVGLRTNKIWLSVGTIEHILMNIISYQRVNIQSAFCFCHQHFLNQNMYRKDWHKNYINLFKLYPCLIHALAYSVGITHINNIQQKYPCAQMLKKFILVRIYLDACEWIPTQNSVKKKRNLKKYWEREREWIFMSQKNYRVPGLGFVLDIAGFRVQSKCHQGSACLHLFPSLRLLHS